MTTFTRREAYAEIKPKKLDRQALILETLGDRHMTVEDIVDELLRRGHLKYYDRNFVAPRLTELKESGIVKTVGVKVSRRSGKRITLWAREEG